MSQMTIAFAVLAQDDYMHMGQRFRRGSTGVDTNDFVLLFAILIVIALVLILVARFFANRQERGFASQRALFSELCRVHSLNWTSRRLLKRLAEQHGVPPCQLFLEPSRFSKEYCQGPLANYVNEVMSLRDELF